MCYTDWKLRRMVAKERMQTLRRRGGRVPLLPRRRTRQRGGGVWFEGPSAPVRVCVCVCVCVCASVSVSLCLCARGWGGLSGSRSSACWRSSGASFPLAAESDAVRSKQSAKRTCAQRRGSACVMRGAALADLRTSSLKLAGEGRGGIVFQVNVVAGHPHLEPREEGDPARLHVGPRQRALRLA